MPFALLVIAGVAAGLAGSVTGIASIFSYPALLFAGLTPLDANVTNSVALVCISIGSTTASRRELAGQGPFLRPLVVPSLAGGLVGATVLLRTPAAAFAWIVPFIVAGAAVVILIPRSGNHPAEGWSRTRLVLAVVAIAVYCGYFGAAAGTLVMALLVHATSYPLPQANAIKNVLLGLANGIAAFLYVFSGRVNWAAAAPLALGLLVGGWTGPALVRRLDHRALRIMVAGAGFVVAAWLLSRA